ncbi:MAG: hypothetical protein NWF13_02045 [Candidatus Bathyarchaeota archaeon]|nr:hypothetical protein [Candidatus Bathyarchaeota archaeon]
MGRKDDLESVGELEKRSGEIDRTFLFKLLIQLDFVFCCKKEKGCDGGDMSIIKEELKATVDPTPFKNREEVKVEIRDCNRFAAVSQYACFIFAALGVISDVVDVTLGLESMSWFLLAIVAGLNAIIGHTHVVVAKHLLGIEAKSKQES